MDIKELVVEISTANYAPGLLTGEIEFQPISQVDTGVREPWMHMVEDQLEPETIILKMSLEIVPANDPADIDGDGILDEGGPDFCTGGETEGCRDNCKYIPNPGQEDTGGIHNDPPDGIGDACQCGDVTGDGKLNSADATMIIRKALGLSAPLFTVPCNCDVTNDGICDQDDANAVVHKALGLTAPTFGNYCGNYTGICECDEVGNCFQ